jgi:hypothetical protein
MRSIHVLGKAVTGWQVIPAGAADFEEVALRACDLVMAGEPRIGKAPEGRRATGRIRNVRRVKRPCNHEGRHPHS